MKGERMGSNGRPGGKADGEIRKVVSALWKRRNLYFHALFGITQEFHLKRLKTGTDRQDILPARLSLSAHSDGKQPGPQNIHFRGAARDATSL